MKDNWTRIPVGIIGITTGLGLLLTPFAVVGIGVIAASISHMFGLKNK